MSSSQGNDALGPPRRSMTGYNFFFQEERRRFLQQKNEERGPKLFAAMGKAIGKKWTSLSAELRAPYYQRAEEDKKRYRREKKEYEQRVSMEAQQKRQREEIAQPVLPVDPVANERLRQLTQQQPALLDTPFGLTPTATRANLGAGPVTLDCLATSLREQQLIVVEQLARRNAILTSLLGAQQLPSSGQPEDESPAKRRRQR